MSKIVQFRGFIFGPPNDFIPPDIFNLSTKGLISLLNSIAKKSKNMSAKKLNKAIFVDAGRSKKRNFINYGFRNNSSK